MKLFDTNLVAQGLLFEAIFVRSFDEYKAKGGEHETPSVWRNSISFNI